MLKYLNVWKQLASPLSLGQRDGARGLRTECLDYAGERYDLAC